jgi:ubiquinone/menaquinone biosynthesis C-methylase UbiE
METIDLYRIESTYYDLTWGDRTQEAGFYSEMASSYGKKVFELGVGTAALAIPLVLDGYEVTGIDNSPDMLAVAHRKLGKYDQNVQERLKLVNADMRDFDLAERSYDFAFIAFNTFLHILTHDEQLSCLHSVSRHLRSRGGFVIDIFQFDPRRPEGVLRFDNAARDPVSGAEVIKYFEQSMDYAKQLIKIRNVYSVTQAGNTRITTTEYNLRIILLGELKLLLDKAGFDVVNVFGSFDKVPHNTTSKKMILLTEKR